MAILITRPDKFGQELAQMLNKVGIANLHFPLFTIEAGRELNLLPHKLYQLQAGDYVFLVSKNAVKLSHQTLQATGFEWRADLDYFSVGRGTAEYFCQLAQRSISYPLQENSEGLLNLPAMQQIKGKNILILRGNTGREYFPQQAQLRGANVQLLETYQRIPLDYDCKTQIDLWKRANITQLLVTSVEILQAMIDFVPREEQNWLKSCQLITISQRIADLALAVGWERDRIIISAKADNVSLVNQLLID